MKFLSGVLGRIRAPNESSKENEALQFITLGASPFCGTFPANHSVSGLKLFPCLFKSTSSFGR